MDFLELYREYGCVLQTGGSDQWGNLTSGTDLIHRPRAASVHAIGTPLITNTDGTKFGKSEGNAVWLDPALTSPVRVLPVLAQHRRRGRGRPAQGVHLPARAPRSSGCEARSRRAVQARGAAGARARR